MIVLLLLAAAVGVLSILSRSRTPTAWAYRTCGACGLDEAAIEIQIESARRLPDILNKVGSEPCGSGFDEDELCVMCPTAILTAAKARNAAVRGN